MKPLRSIQLVLLIGALSFFVLGGSWMVFDIAIGGGLGRATGDLSVAVRFDSPVLLCLGAGAFCMLASVATFLRHLLSNKSA
jgi:hypothetical protein